MLVLKTFPAFKLVGHGTCQKFSNLMNNKEHNETRGYNRILGENFQFEETFQLKSNRISERRANIYETIFMQKIHTSFNNENKD